MGSAKIKVIKSENYTVISNIACRDKRLSMKALGVHTFMMQLPDNWDYSLAGLAKCHADGIDAIRSAINELIQFGYVYRFRAKDEKGLFTDSEYLVFESPECNEHYQQELKKTAETADIHPRLENPMLDNPTLEKPILEKPMLENPMQISTKGNKALNEINNESINPSEGTEDPMDGQNETGSETKEEIQKQITDQLRMKDLSPEETMEYFKSQYSDQQYLQIIRLITDVVSSPGGGTKINGVRKEWADVRDRFLQLKFDDVACVIDSLRNNPTEVKNIRAYLIAALYNAPTTTNSYYSAKLAWAKSPNNSETSEGEN